MRYRWDIRQLNGLWLEIPFRYSSVKRGLWLEIPFRYSSVKRIVTWDTVEIFQLNAKFNHVLHINKKLICYCKQSCWFYHFFYDQCVVNIWVNNISVIVILLHNLSWTLTIHCVWLSIMISLQAPIYPIWCMLTAVCLSSCSRTTTNVMVI